MRKIGIQRAVTRLFVNFWHGAVHNIQICNAHRKCVISRIGHTSAHKIGGGYKTIVLHYYSHYMRWTNNACESVNHVVLKQRMQWRLTHPQGRADNLLAAS